MIPREEVELDDVTSYNIFDTKIYKISSYSNSKIKKKKDGCKRISKPNKMRL
jgi:hypothetical protein